MGSAKIIVSLDGEVLREVSLANDRTTIGRRPYNDIVLDNASISGEHAMIATVRHECILEDLNSTNGTYVNGQPVKKHFLQNNDVIEVVKYRLHYIDAAHADQPAPQAPRAEIPAAAPAEPAMLRVLIGTNASQTMALTKDVTTLGRAGTQVVSITRRAGGYALAQVEGAQPLINGHPVNTHRLNNGDVIDLSGTLIEFSLD